MLFSLPGTVAVCFFITYAAIYDPMEMEFKKRGFNAPGPDGYKIYKRAQISLKNFEGLISHSWWPWLKKKLQRMLQDKALDRIHRVTVGEEDP